MITTRTVGSASAKSDGTQYLAHAAGGERVVMLGPVQRDAPDVADLLDQEGGEFGRHDRTLRVDRPAPAGP